jgi:hypothetical protein
VLRGKFDTVITKPTTRREFVSSPCIRPVWETSPLQSSLSSSRSESSSFTVSASNKSPCSSSSSSSYRPAFSNPVQQFAAASKDHLLSCASTRYPRFSHRFPNSVCGKVKGKHRESPRCAPGTLLNRCRLHKTKKHTRRLCRQVARSLSRARSLSDIVPTPSPGDHGSRLSVVCCTTCTSPTLNVSERVT